MDQCHPFNGSWNDKTSPCFLSYLRSLFTLYGLSVDSNVKYACNALTQIEIVMYEMSLH